MYSIVNALGTLSSKVSAFGGDDGGCFFAVGTSHSYKKGDEWVKEEGWVECIANGYVAKTVKSAPQNSKVFISGRIITLKPKKEGDKSQMKVRVDNIKILGDAKTTKKDEEEDLF